MPDLKLNDKYEQAFTVTGTVYEGFKQIFKDENPLHTDSQFAAGHGYKGCVMYGNILNGFLSYFIGECLPDKNVIILSQEIQFINAVYLNDKLYFEASVTGVYESVNAFRFQFTFKNEALNVVAKGRIQIGKLK